MTTVTVLSPDLWVQIGLHLKPRHLAKLIATSKTMKKLVDNDTYWTRVAAHMVWRENNYMFVHTPPVMYASDFDGHLHRIHHNLYHMIGLEHGYYWSMERFFQRMEEVIDYYSNYVGNNAKVSNTKQVWTLLKPMSLLERTSYLVSEYASKNPHMPKISDEWATEHDETTLSMKDLAKSRTLKSLHAYGIDDECAEAETMFNKFTGQMDDERIPVAYKQVIFKKLRKLFFKVDMLLLKTGKKISMFDVARCICPI
jgi:hypothetical protein